MITALVRRTHSCLKSSSSLCNSHGVFSSFLFHFSTRPTLFDSTITESLLHKHQFSPEAASQVASVLTGLRNPKNADSVISFLKENGFTKTQMDKMVIIWPQLLCANLENTVMPKLKIFQDLGFSTKDVAHIFSNDPWIFAQSLKNRIIPSLSTLKSLLGSYLEVSKLLKRSRWSLQRNLDNNLVKNVEFLKNCGMAHESIVRTVHRYPRFLLHKPENVKKFVDKVEEMGVSRSSGMFIHAVQVTISMSEEIWELKLRNFRNMGFSEDNITTTIRTAPLVFGVSEQKIKEVKEILLATGKYKMSCIIDNPVSFMYSIDKRYKPRLQVLEILESKNIIATWPCLSTFCRMSDEKFYGKFVGPYLDQLGDVYMAKTAVSGKRKTTQKKSS